MSVVFPIREVVSGPTVGITGQGSAASAVYVNLPVYLHGEIEQGKGKELELELEMDGGDGRSGFCFGRQEEEVESSESSSIGVGGESSPSTTTSSTVDDREADGEDEVQSKLKKDPLGSLDSLEESLPIKRGLSNFYAGKSKSFASLTEAESSNPKDLAKPENPFNKRRRILMACKASRSRRASYSSLYTSLPPLLSPDHTVEEEEEDEDERRGANSPSSSSIAPPLPLHGRKIKAFRSPRSYSLSDLQHAQLNPHKPNRI